MNSETIKAINKAINEHFKIKNKARSSRNKYAIGDKIGSGGFADVFSIVNVAERVNEGYVVKIININNLIKANEIEILDAFKKEEIKKVNREVDVHDKLRKQKPKCDNILYLEGKVQIDSDFLLLIMKKMQYTFAQYANIVGYSDELAFQLLYDVINAMTVYNKDGLVHRDLTPYNIFIKNLEQKGKVRFLVGDFGIAKFANKDGLVINTTGNRPGSHYAPEQDYTQSESNITTDIFTLGLGLYEWGYYKSKNSPSLQDLFVDIRNNKITGENFFVENRICDELKPVLRKMLQVELENRYDSIAMLKEDVDKAKKLYDHRIEKIKNLPKELTEVNKRITDLEREKLKLNREKIELKRKNADLSKKNEEIHRNNTPFIIKGNISQDKVALLYQENERLNSDNAELIKKNNAVNRENLALKNEKKFLKDKTKQLEKENEKLCKPISIKPAIICLAIGVVIAVMMGLYFPNILSSPFNYLSEAIAGKAICSEYNYFEKGFLGIPKKSGAREIVYANGNIFLDNDASDGIAEMRFANGDKLTCEYDDGFNGEGTFTFADGKTQGVLYKDDEYVSNIEE